MMIKELNVKQLEEIATFFKKVFSQEPWYDDWSDEQQLYHNLIDLMGNNNSLVFGLFEQDQMRGLAIGHIRHWYQGTEYRIDELCIETKYQGKGLGTSFLKKIEKKIKEQKIETIFLQTGRDIPAYHFYKKNGFTTVDDLITLVKNVGDLQ